MSEFQSEISEEMIKHVFYNCTNNFANTLLHYFLSVRETNKLFSFLNIFGLFHLSHFVNFDFIFLFIDIASGFPLLNTAAALV